MEMCSDFTINVEHHCPRHSWGAFYTGDAISLAVHGNERAEYGGGHNGCNISTKRTLSGTSLSKAVSSSSHWGRLQVERIIGGNIAAMGGIQTTIWLRSRHRTRFARRASSPEEAAATG